MRPTHLAPLASVLTFLCVLVVICLDQTKALTEDVAIPEEVDMDSAVLKDMTKELQALTDQKLIPGAIVMMSRRGKLVFKTRVGYDRDDIIFRLFSMSKPIAAVGVLLLIQEGLIESLDDPVGKYIPEFAHMNVIKGNNPRPNWFQTEPARSPITVRHLLTHTAGFTYGYTNTTVDALYRRNQVYQYISKRESMDEFIREVSELPLLFHPGKHWWYCIGFDVAGALIEKVSGMKLDKYLKARVFEPLDMKDTGFYVPPDKMNRLAPYVIVSGQNVLTLPEQAMLMNDYAKDPDLRLAGMGLVATASDYFNFAQMLYNDGMVEGKQFLSADLVNEMLIDQLSDDQKPFQMNYEYYPNVGFTLGSQIQLVESAKEPKGEVMWGGQACTKYIISRERETVIVAMTQKSPFPNQVADIAKKYTYKSETDFPPLADSPDLLVLEPAPSMGLRDALPFFKNGNPFANDFAALVAPDKVQQQVDAKAASSTSAAVKQPPQSQAPQKKKNLKK